MAETNANKKDLITAVQGELEVSGNEATKIVNTVLEKIEGLTIEHKKLGLSKFGTFEIRNRAARKGHNMQTGEEMDIPASDAPAFKPSASFKQAVKDAK